MGLKGIITVPGDKSISHRAVILGGISNGVSRIENFLTGDDCLSTISCLSKLGVDIQTEGSTIKINGKGMKLKAPTEILYTGNSGTTTRLLMGLMAGQPFCSEITGDASIQKRPMQRVIDPLRAMSAQITAADGGNCPVSIKGSKLRAINYTLPVASAQLKSALLLAGLYADGTTKIIEPQKSRNHTELMLEYFGADIKTCGQEISINRAESLKAQHIDVPSDISSAAYFMVAALIVPNSEITIKSVGINPTRRGIIDVLKQMGGSIVEENIEHINNEKRADITIKCSSLKGVALGGEIIPNVIDEIPIIAVAAAFAKGVTVIKDAQELKVKESNRIRAMVNEMTKAGVDITETDDGMIINPNSNVHSAVFECYNDHRIAMSLSILSLMTGDDSEIKNKEVVDISFPGFFKTRENLMR